MSDNQFSKEDLDQILKRAVRTQHEKDAQYSEEEIICAAKEMGVDESTIRKELNQQIEEKEQKIRDAQFAKKRNLFFIHVVVFLLVNLFVFSSGFRVPGPPMLRIFPFFPWIIFLVFHGFYTFGLVSGDSCRRGQCR